MVDMNSAQVRNQAQLESLDSLKANSTFTPTLSNTVSLQSLDSLRNTNNPNSNTGLQSLDSIRANTYTDPNLNIPANDILAPIDALNPEIPDKSKEDTKERGAAGFVGGVFKGFGKAGIDTVMGVVTLGKVVVTGITQPKKTLNWVGGGLKYAVNHPIGAVKAVAVDLPTGILTGIVKPYGDAIKQGKYGEAVGRGVFDVGLILMTAGLGEEGSKAGSATASTEKASKGAKATTEAVRGSGKGAAVIAEAHVGGDIKLAKDAIKEVVKIHAPHATTINIGDVNVVIGGNVTKVSGAVGGAGEVLSEAGGAIAGIERVAEGSKGLGAVGAGLSDIKGVLGSGASKIGKLFKPASQAVGEGLGWLVGPETLAGIKNGTNAIGKGLAVGKKVIGKGVRIAKAHPIPSALVVGKTVNIVQEGLKQSDQYNPDN